MGSWGQNILITGGAGFLGRGIIRRLEANRERVGVTVYSRDEHKHYLLKNRFPWVRTILGDVTDTARLTAVMTGHDTVIHTAALKHIPEAERDASEAVRVNVAGSLSVLRAAAASGVAQVVGISTDKVCSPRNTYGATKMLMERLFQEQNRLAPRTRFSTVRYGNVVSSTGSVVPLFIRQATQDGVLTLTDPKMTRFWFGVNEAVSLIESALTDEERGAIYVARCPAASLYVVADAAWRMAGKDGQAEYRIIGTRPGEKTHETLIDQYEAPFARPLKGSDNHVMVIPQATSLAGDGGGDCTEYSSDAPERQMWVPEFIDLINDSMDV